MSKVATFGELAGSRRLQQKSRRGQAVAAQRKRTVYWIDGDPHTAVAVAERLGISVEAARHRARTRRVDGKLTWEALA